MGPLRSPHSADLQLSRAFGVYREGIRHQLRGARQESRRVSEKIACKSQRKTATTAQAAEDGAFYSAKEFDVCFVQNVVNGESEENGDAETHEQCRYCAMSK